MALALSLVALVGVGLVLVGVVVAEPLLNPERSLLAAAGLGAGVSVERYRPLLWLLSGGRLQILRSRGGRRREIRVRTRRSRLFRSYLKELRNDFDRTSAALMIVILLSPVDRPDLIRLLVRARIRFRVRLAMAVFRLYRYRFGLP